MIPGEYPKRDFTPRSWRERESDRLKHAFNQFGIVNESNNYLVDPDPQYDYLKKAQQYMDQANRIRMQAADQRGINRNINVANSFSGGGGPKGQFGDFIRAIAGKESGGNYGAVNADSGALGKYQIMPSNISGQGTGWDYEALGKDVGTQQFLNNPRLQEKIARYKLREYYRKYGPAGAASAWYSGDPNKYKTSTHAQGNYPSIYAYVQAILKAMGL